MPQVSVVVPVYNVAAYLDSCLTSIAQQTVSDIEVVVVDDGSTDDSPSIARAWSDRDPRFRLVQKPNGGLGSARNRGVEEATGEFLAFVDSDDMLPARALEYLLGSLRRTGSDFASGNVRRLTSFGTSQTNFLAAVFGRDRPATHVTKFPALLSDRIACNKLFRRAFWDEHQLRFPEGCLYEDVPTIMPAHFLARSVDVVDKTVYLWRVREGGERSITQRRSEIRGLRDRFAAVDTVSRFLAERGQLTEKRAYDAAALREDLRIFLNTLDVAEDDYRHEFLDLANDFLDRADPDVTGDLLALDRLKWELVRRRELPELLEVLHFEDDELVRRAAVHADGQWYGDYPFRDRLPAGLYRLEAELDPVGLLTDLRWDDTGALVVAGAAYIPQVGAPNPDAQTVSIRLQRGPKALATLVAEAVETPQLTARDADGPVDLRWAGFRVVIPSALLRPKQDRARALRLEVDVNAGGVTRTRSTWTWLPGLPMLSAAQRIDGREVVARVRPGDELRVSYGRERCVLRRASLVGPVLQLEGRLESVPDTRLRLLAARRAGGAELTYPVHVDPAKRGARFLGRIPLRDLTAAIDEADRAAHVEEHGDGIVWDLFLDGPDRTRIWFALDDGEVSTALDGREFVLRPSRFGFAAVTERSFRPVLAEVSVSVNGGFDLAGSYAGPVADFLLVAGEARDGSELSFAVRMGGDGTWSATVPLTGVDPRIGPWELPEGRWRLAFRRSGGATVDVVAALSLITGLPVESRSGQRIAVFGVRHQDEPVIHVSSDLAPEERGLFNELRLEREVYAAGRRLPLREAVLYLCRGGREHDGSPRAIREELARRQVDVEHLWAVVDGRFPAPPGTRAVAVGSSEYVDALATARFVVSDDYWPDVVERREDQTFLQTWHGLPLREAGVLLLPRRTAHREYRRAAGQRPGNWEHLLSAGPTMTEALRAAFPYAGHIHETGLPGTDLLVNATPESRSAARAALGLPASARVLLYAPARRDHLAFGRRVRFRLGHTLDRELLRQGLGDDWVVLFRRDHDVVGRWAPAGDPFVVDVSAHTSPSALLLAADVLVSDYSSLVVDQLVAGRPVLAFAPDHEEYVTEVRGVLPWYGDLPVPMLRRTEDVVEILRQVAAGHDPVDAAGRAAFVERYLPHVDGMAAARAVDVLLGRGG